MGNVSGCSCSFAHSDQSLVREVRLNQARLVNKVRNTNLLQVNWRHHKPLRPRKHLRGVARVYLCQDLVVGLTVTLSFHFFEEWRAPIHLQDVIIIPFHEKCVVCIWPQWISRLDSCLKACRVFVPVVTRNISLLWLSSTKVTDLTPGCGLPVACVSFLSLRRSYFVRLAFLCLDLEA